MKATDRNKINLSYGRQKYPKEKLELSDLLEVPSLRKVKYRKDTYEHKMRQKVHRD